jgi:hypothetical protein
MRFPRPGHLPAARVADTELTNPANQGVQMQIAHNGRHAKLVLATVFALVVGLVGTTSATAAPPDRVTNARKCLWGGWQKVQPSETVKFTGLAGCLIFALRGNQFSAAPIEPPAGSGQ